VPLRAKADARASHPAHTIVTGARVLRRTLRTCSGRAVSAQVAAAAGCVTTHRVAEDGARGRTRIMHQPRIRTSPPPPSPPAPHAGLTRFPAPILMAAYLFLDAVLPASEPERSCVRCSGSTYNL